MPRTLLAACLALLPAAALAETIGTVTAAFDGAEARTFHAIELDGESQSFWIETMPGMLSMSSFSIWANPDDATNATSDVIILTGTLVRAPSGFSVAADALYLEDGFGRSWMPLEEGTVRIDVSEVEVRGDKLFVAGTFSAPLTYAEGAPEPVFDPERSLALTGSFSATLPKE